MVSKIQTITEIITLYRKIKKHFPDSMFDKYQMQYDFQKLKNIKQSKYFLFNGSEFYQNDILNNLPLNNYKEEINTTENESLDEQYSDIFHANDDELDHNDSSNDLNKEECLSKPIPKKENKDTKANKIKYWLNIFKPTQLDIDFLYSEYSIHPTSLADILESNTDEKIDLYSDYTFISLKLLTSNQNEDIDLNIIILNNCIITTYNNQWSGMNDIINFLFLLIEHTKFKTHWVVFSILVEVLQDIKFKTDLIEEIITEEKKNNKHNVIPPAYNTKRSFLFRQLNNNDSLINFDLLADDFEFNYEIFKSKTDSNLKCNFDLTNKISNLLSYIKSKKHILKEIIKNTIQRKKKALKKINHENISNLMSYYFALLTDDFTIAEDILKDLQKNLERQQDLLLALLDMKQSSEANEMSRAINRFALITFIFLPCQTIAGLWGMNVDVPFEKSGKIPFYILTFFGFFFSFVLFYIICRKKGSKVKKFI